MDALLGTELDGLVDTLVAGSVRMTEDALTGRGLVVPPTVHMMSRYAHPPYLGAVTTRGFYRGLDAAEAVTRLGLLPAAAAALRLLVVWEHADLCAALDLPGWQEGRFPHGLVVVDAHADERLGHTVRWHPFELVGVDPLTRPVHRGLTAQGWPVVPRWGTAARYPDGRLPEPVAQLLAVWRAPGGAVDGREAVARVRAELKELWRLVQRLAPAAGIPDLGKADPHSMRHTAITLALERGRACAMCRTSPGTTTPHQPRRAVIPGHPERGRTYHLGFRALSRVMRPCRRHGSDRPASPRGQPR